MGIPQCIQPSTPWTVQLFHLSFHRGLYRLFNCVPHRLSSCYIKHGVGCLTGFPTMFLEDVPLLLQDILSQMGFLRSGRLNGFLRWLVKSLSSAYPPVVTLLVMTLGAVPNTAIKAVLDFPAATLLFPVS